MKDVRSPHTVPRTAGERLETKQRSSRTSREDHQGPSAHDGVGTRYAAVVLNRRVVGSDGKTAHERIKGMRSLWPMCEWWRTLSSTRFRALRVQQRRMEALGMVHIAKDFGENLEVSIKIDAKPTVGTLHRQGQAETRRYQSGVAAGEGCERRDYVGQYPP